MTDNAFIHIRPVIKLDGEVRNDLGESLTGMVANLPLNGSAHAEVHLTNWGLNEGGRMPDFIFGDVDLGTAVEILMPEGGEIQSIFQGEVTALEERYGEGGAPNIVMLIQDRLHRLARSRHSRCFEEQSPDEIVQAIAGEAGLRSDVNASSITSSWHQINESDLAFAQRLLGRFDIALRLQDDTVRARPEEPDPEPLPLDAQDSASYVRLLSDLNHQPTSSRVRGYNPAAAEATDHEADSLTPAPGDVTAADNLNRLGWPGPEIVPQPFARTMAEARAYAEAHFRRMAKRFLSGEITCQGEPRMHSGREVELTGVSPRLRGKYQVVHCVHLFNNESGYDTHLTVHRPDWSNG